MANKITKREIITNLMNGTMLATDEVAQAYFAHELELLDKKSQNRKPASEKEENVALANSVLEVLGSATEKMSTTEIGSAVGISTSKATSILKGLVSSGKVVREVVKGKPMFELA
jgi:IclR helix-turn-helix domain.